MNIGFIGTGLFGRHLAQNVLKGGYNLAVHDLRKVAAQPLLDNGAQWISSPKKVAQSCQVVLSSLPGPPEVEEVVYGAEGLMAGWKKGDIYVDMSTNSPTIIRQIAEDAKAKGVDVVDAPVSGGHQRAVDGKLLIMVGGNVHVFERVREILEKIGSDIFHFGDVGCGNVVKLISNMIGLTSGAINAEGFVLGVKAGVDIRKLYKALKLSTANNWQLENVYPSILQGDFDNKWRLSLALKDLSLAVSLGKEHGVPLPAGATVEQRFIDACAAGLGDKSVSSLILRLEEIAGVRVRLEK